MNVELTANEVKCLLGALEAYRRIKSAERMLTAHKEKSAELMAPVFARYDVVLGTVKSVQVKLNATE